LQYGFNGILKCSKSEAKLSQQMIYPTFEILAL